MQNEKQLISREDLLAEYDRVHIGPPGGARKLIAEAPAVDAVEVVRCKDCKFTRKKSKHEEMLYAEDVYICTLPNVFGVPTNELVWNDHFCACGERRTNNE